MDGLLSSRRLTIFHLRICAAADRQETPSMGPRDTNFDRKETWGPKEGLYCHLPGRHKLEIRKKEKISAGKKMTY